MVEKEGEKMRAKVNWLMYAKICEVGFIIGENNEIRMVKIMSDIIFYGWNSDNCGRSAMVEEENIEENAVE